MPGELMHRQTDKQGILAMLDEDAVLPEILQFLGPTQLSFSRGPRGVLAKWASLSIPFCWGLSMTGSALYSLVWDKPKSPGILSLQVSLFSASTPRTRSVWEGVSMAQTHSVWLYGRKTKDLGSRQTRAGVGTLSERCMPIWSINWRRYFPLGTPAAQLKKKRYRNWNCSKWL